MQKQGPFFIALKKKYDLIFVDCLRGITLLGE